MNIVYTINKKFFYQLYVSIKSMILHSNSNFNIYIIIDELDYNKKIELKKLSNLTVSKVNILFLEPIDLGDLNLKNDRGSNSQYYRLFLDKIFEKNNLNINNFSKLLYLDADTMIVNDIKYIFDTDLSEYTLGACLDAWSPYYRKLFNLSCNTPMLNSGLLLINVIKWKNQNISNQLMNLINKRDGFFNQGDQGILNEFFKGKFRILSLKYNLNTIDIEFDYNEINKYRKPVSFYNYNNYKEAKKNPIIIHFISSFLLNRPWEYQIDSYYMNLWRKYCSNIKNFNHLKERKSCLFYLYSKFNKRISIYLLGILQAYVRPIIIRINKMIL